MPKMEYCVSIPEELNQRLQDYLVREDGDEDLIFALWLPSYGTLRTTGLVKEIIRWMEIVNDMAT